MKTIKDRRVKKLMSMIVSVSFLLQAGHLYIYANEGYATDINTTDNATDENYDISEDLANDKSSDITEEIDQKDDLLQDDQSLDNSGDITDDIVNEDASNIEEKSEEVNQQPIGDTKSTLDVNDVVVFKDNVFKNLINAMLNQNPGDDITVSQMESLTGMLNMTHSGITDITGIQHCKNITRINMWENQISDISPLADLKNLTYIDLYKNKIDNISALKDLTNLEELFIEGNQISDISSLYNLTNLVQLRLDNNKISDISALQNLSNLTDLWLDGNQIYDITPLKGLNRLKELRLDNQSIIGPEINTDSVANMVKDKDGNFVAPANSLKYEYSEIENRIKFLNVTDDRDVSYAFSTDINIGSANSKFSGIVTHSIKNINMISVTVPISAGFQLATNIIDENGNPGFEFLSSEYRIVNNSNKAIKVSISGFSEHIGNTLDLVNPDEKDWGKINSEDSMKFMAVGIYNHSGFKDTTISKSNPIWLTDNTPMSLLGSIEEGGKEGMFTFTSKHGKDPTNSMRASKGEFDLKLQIEIIK